MLHASIGKPKGLVRAHLLLDHIVTAGGSLRVFLSIQCYCKKVWQSIRRKPATFGRVKLEALLSHMSETVSIRERHLNELNRMQSHCYCAYTCHWWKLQNSGCVHFLHLFYVWFQTWLLNSGGCYRTQGKSGLWNKQVDLRTEWFGCMLIKIEHHCITWIPSFI